MKSCPSSEKMSWTVTMPGWVSAEAALAQLSENLEVSDHAARQGVGASLHLSLGSVGSPL